MSQNSSDSQSGSRLAPKTLNSLLLFEGEEACMHNSQDNATGHRSEIVTIRW